MKSCFYGTFFIIAALVNTIFPILSPSPLFAGESSGMIDLTMKTAISTALTQNNNVRSSEYAEKKAKWDKLNAWSLLFPTLAFNTGYTNLDSDITDMSTETTQWLEQFGYSTDDNSYSSSLQASMPLFNSALINSISIARTNSKRTMQENKSTRDFILFQVISNYLYAVKSKKIVALQKDYLELSHLNYKKAERLERAQRYSKAETLRWHVEYQQQKKTVVSSESALRSSKIQLARLLNINMLQTIQIENRIPDSLLNESRTLSLSNDEDILDMINIDDLHLVHVNANLTAKKTLKKIGRLNYRQTYSSYMPYVNMNYNYSWESNDTMRLDGDNTKTFSVNCNVPLFKSFQNVTAGKSAYYEYQQAKEAFSSELQNTRRELVDTANKIINLKTQQELSIVNVDFAEHNYRIVEQRKDRGLVSNIDFLDAKVTLQSAKLDLITTRYDFITALVELYYYLGKLEQLFPDIY